MAPVSGARDASVKDRPPLRRRPSTGGIARSNLSIPLEEGRGTRSARPQPGCAAHRYGPPPGRGDGRDASPVADDPAGASQCIPASARGLQHRHEPGSAGRRIGSPGPVLAIPPTPASDRERAVSQSVSAPRPARQSGSTSPAPLERRGHLGALANPGPTLSLVVRPTSLPPSATAVAGSLTDCRNNCDLSQQS